MQRRILFTLLFMMVCFVLLIVRLVFIQIIDGEELAMWAVRQRSQSIVLGHGRGDIQDRHGRSLLYGDKEEALVAFPSLYRGKEDVIRGQLPYQNLLDKIIYPPHERFPFVVEKGSQGALAYLSDDTLPGLVKAGIQARYGPEVLATHTVGHIRNSDGEGQKGIELFFNTELSGGQPPILSAFVDGRENLIEGLGIRLRGTNYDYVKPYNVVLSIDYELQRYVEKIMDSSVSRGAVVVMDPSDGDILALASRPNYQPAAVERYLGRDDGPFNNRITTSYQPGSVFKTVLAAAALEEEVVTLFQDFRCTGSITLDENSIGCPHIHPDQGLTFTEAFAYSCNTTFIRLGQELGAETIEKYARMMGLGEKAGLPLGEDAGFIPSPELIVNEVSLANTSIGQELVEVTPLQVAKMMSIIANDGKNIDPRLVLSITDRNNRTVKVFSPSGGEQVLSFSTVNKLKYMLNCTTLYGTGRAASNPDFMVGGKTGTAQTGRIRNGREVLNYWFAGMAPLGNPKLVIVVFLEERSHASAAEIFRLIYEKAFSVIE